VAIAGTSSIKHVLQDLRFFKVSHPSGKGLVHGGFWAMYQGLKDQLLLAIERAIADHSPTEVVLTGHSMGGSIAYLLSMDLLLSTILNLKVVVFGAPRAGDAALVDYYRDLVASFRKTHSFKDYSVKGWNDGQSFLVGTESVMLTRKRRAGTPSRPYGFSTLLCRAHLHSRRKALPDTSHGVRTCSVSRASKRKGLLIPKRWT
jgi:pimeloyl-ACP methyl ester carboxylesterase